MKSSIKNIPCRKVFGHSNAYFYMNNVIFHLHDKDNIATAFSNINNLIKDVEGDLSTILLMNGDAVVTMADKKYINKVAYFQKKGVEFKVCKNSLKAFHIDQNDLITGVTPVPAGVAELVRKQNQGWAYIKV